MHEKHWLTDGITIQHISSTNRHPRLAALRSSVPETNDTACNKAITAGRVIIKESTCVRNRLGAFVRVRHMHSDICNDCNDRKRYFEFTGARKSAHESLFLLNIPHHYDCSCDSTKYTARVFWCCSTCVARTSRTSTVLYGQYQGVLKQYSYGTRRPLPYS